MHEQLFLLDVPPPPPPTDSLFLAIIPDAITLAKIDQIAGNAREKYHLSGKPLGPSRFHVSLHSLWACSGVPPDLVSTLGKVFAPMAASLPPFEVSFDRALSFDIGAGKLPFVLRDNGDNAALIEFQQRLGMVLRRRKKTFTPHLTLLYDAKRIAEHALEPVRWTVGELVLVRSFIGAGRHEHLVRWPLRG